MLGAESVKSSQAIGHETAQTHQVNGCLGQRRLLRQQVPVLLGPPSRQTEQNQQIPAARRGLQPTHILLPAPKQGARAATSAARQVSMFVSTKPA